MTAWAVMDSFCLRLAAHVAPFSAHFIQYMGGKRMPVRSEIDNEFKWAVNDLYSTDEVWEKDYIRDI